MLLNYFLLLLTFDSILCIESNYVKVNTSSGLVEGKVLDVLNTTVNQFLGIPFAEPPLAGLRFAKPEPLKKPFNSIIDAKEPKNTCIQANALMKFDNMTESEDCLVLNIWSTDLALNKSNTKLKPVMFWIYGGGFGLGSIFQLELYDGRVLATNDVVVVSANYRLGVFGFLYGGEESAPGNVGLYDQALALKWVKQNIHLFGGNPDMITIFGESAGSFSVSAHILSPISRNLFRRAILQSGALFSRLAEMEHKNGALNKAKDFSKSFNCSEDNKWLDCLRKLDSKQLNSHNFGASLIVETDFLPQYSEKAFISGNFRKGIDIMAGVTKDEGSYLISPTEQDFNLTISDVLNLMKPWLHQGMDHNIISNYYLSKIDTNNETALKIAFAELVGDVEITCPTHFFVQEFAKYSPNDSIYFYELTHKQNGKPFWGCRQDWKGVCHGSEIPFVFGLPLLQSELSSDIDKNFSKLIMQLWTDFAKTGKPLSTSSAIQWPKLQNSSNVMELNPKNFGNILNEPFHSNCDGFWKQYFF